MNAIMSNFDANYFERMYALLKVHGIDRIYHFTDIRNYESIKKCGGLLSWWNADRNGVTIPFPGGNDGSRSLDWHYGLFDFVRFSFCKDHPMIWRLQQNGYDLVMLEFDLEILKNCFFGFSDQNATANGHKVEFGPKGIELVNLQATQRQFVKKTDPDFGPHQAEILVRGYAPLKYLIQKTKI